MWFVSIAEKHLSTLSMPITRVSRTGHSPFIVVSCRKERLPTLLIKSIRAFEASSGSEMHAINSAGCPLRPTNVETEGGVGIPFPIVMAN